MAVIEDGLDLLCLESLAVLCHAVTVDVFWIVGPQEHVCLGTAL